MNNLRTSDGDRFVEAEKLSIFLFLIYQNHELKLAIGGRKIAYTARV